MKTVCGRELFCGEFVVENTSDGETCLACEAAWELAERSNTQDRSVNTFEPWKSVMFWRKSPGLAVHYVLPEVAE